jgi:hypothetical protein
MSQMAPVAERTRDTPHAAKLPVQLRQADVVGQGPFASPASYLSCDRDVSTLTRPVDGLVCRPIEFSDLAAVTELLRNAFANRTGAYWSDGLRRFAAHARADGMSQLGYLLGVDNAVVGVLLLIHGRASEGPALRCNVSSWYVRPEYRPYAALLNRRATSNRKLTYINISPAQHTLPIIEASGFTRAPSGCFIGVPALSGPRRGVTVSVLSEQWRQSELMPVEDERLLSDHARFGCICVWLEANGRGYPFIFRRRVIRKHRVPCAMLLYCRSIEELERFAGVLGRVLLIQGLPLMLVGTERPLRGIAGGYFPTKLPIYYKGDLKPRTGDLSYTEAALFGM